MSTILQKKKNHGFHSTLNFNLKNITTKTTHAYTVFSYLQEAGKFDDTPSKTLAFWFHQTHLVHIYSEESLGLSPIFTDHHTGYQVTVIWKRDHKHNHQCFFMFFLDLFLYKKIKSHFWNCCIYNIFNMPFVVWAKNSVLIIRILLNKGLFTPAKVFQGSSEVFHTHQFEMSWHVCRDKPNMRHVSNLGMYWVMSNLFV